MCTLVSLKLPVWCQGKWQCHSHQYAAKSPSAPHLCYFLGIWQNLTAAVILCVCVCVCVSLHTHTHTHIMVSVACRNRQKMFGRCPYEAKPAAASIYHTGFRDLEVSVKTAAFRSNRYRKWTVVSLMWPHRCWGNKHNWAVSPSRSKSWNGTKSCLLIGRKPLLRFGKWEVYAFLFENSHETNC